MNVKIVLSLLFCSTIVFADIPQCKGCYITVSAEQAFTRDLLRDSLNADGSFQVMWLYMGLPSFKIASKNIFSAIEIDLMHRSISYGGRPWNDHSNLFHRYGLFGGITIFSAANQKGTFMIGGGIATDFSDMHSDIGYIHLIYDHRFVVSEKLTVGLGVLAQYHFDTWRKPINLLPTVKWAITPHTNLAVSWDNLQLKQEIFSKILAVGEVRYDLSFFRTRDQLSYELETVSAGGGIHFRLSRNLSLQLRYLELLMHREIIRRNGDMVLDTDGGRGRSIKINLVKD